MVYECIKGFSVNIVDGDGFTEVQDGFVVEDGTKWKVDNDAVNVTGAEIHLEEITGLNWLEVCKETLSTNFREINIDVEDNKCCNTCRQGMQVSDAELGYCIRCKSNGEIKDVTDICDNFR